MQKLPNLITLFVSKLIFYPPKKGSNSSKTEDNSYGATTLSRKTFSITTLSTNGIQHKHLVS